MKRQHGERDIAQTARRLYAAMVRHTDRAEDERGRATDARRRLEVMQDGLSSRFGGLIIPPDPHLMDVLGLIDVEKLPGRDARIHIWHWKGTYTAEGQPVIRIRSRTSANTEHTAPRWLAKRFLLIPDDEPRILRRSETRPVDDVNPWCRYLGGTLLLDR